MRLKDRHRDRGYSHFRATYKPHIRPKDHLRQMRRAFDVDVHFEEEFTLLRPWLQRTQSTWVDQIVDILLQYDGIGAEFNEGDKQKLRNLYRRHANAFASGRFGDDYLDTLEDVALFFLFHGVRSVWLAGAYGRLTEQAVDYFFEIAQSRRQAPVKRLMRCFSKGMTIELSQIQRVFICYERHLQSVSLGHLAEIGPEKQIILQDSFRKISKNPSALSRKFFSQLEEQAPELCAHVPADEQARTTLLLDTITIAIASINDPDAVSSLRAKGQALTETSFLAEHHSVTEAAFLSAMKQVFGVRWQGDLVLAWTGLFEEASSIVFEARREASSSCYV